MDIELQDVSRCWNFQVSSGLQDERVTDSDGGYGCTTLWMC